MYVVTADYFVEAAVKSGERSFGGIALVKSVNCCDTHIQSGMTRSVCSGNTEFEGVLPRGVFTPFFKSISSCAHLRNSGDGKVDL